MRLQSPGVPVVMTDVCGCNSGTQQAAREALLRLAVRARWTTPQTADDIIEMANLWYPKQSMEMK